MGPTLGTAITSCMSCEGPFQVLARVLSWTTTLLDDSKANNVAQLHALAKQTQESPGLPHLLTTLLT